MNSTAVILIGVVVVVLLLSRPKAAAVLSSPPGPQAPVQGAAQNEAPNNTYQDVVGAMTAAFNGIAAVVQAGTQRN